MLEDDVDEGTVSQVRLERLDAVLGLLLCLLSIASVSFFVRDYRAIGPIDELQHIDYAARVSRGDLVELGTKVGTTAMREEACRGIDADFQPPPCDARRLRPEQFQEEGYNTAAAHPPTYYLVSGVMARMMGFVGVDSFVTALRLTGGVWLAAGLVTTYLLALRLGARRVPAFSICLGLLFTPLVIYTAGTANNDAPAVFVGALAVLLTVKVREEELPAYVLAIAGFVVGGIKATNLVVLGLCLGLLVLRGMRSADTGRRSRLLVAGGWLCGSTVITLLGWNAVVALTTVIPASEIPMTRRFVIQRLQVRHVVSQALAGVPPTATAYRPGFLGNIEVSIWTRMLDVGIVAATAIAAVAEKGGALVRRIGGLSLLAMLAVGPFFVVLNYVQYHTFVPIPSRYGMALLAPALAAFAAAVRRRVTMFAVAGVVAYGVTMVATALVA